MKKFLIIILSLLLTAALLAGCGPKDEATLMEKIQKKLTSMETYKSKARITQTSNKGEREYEIVHWVKISGEYRMEILSPEKTKGTVTIYNGQSTVQYNPNIEGSLKIDLPVSQIRNELLLGSFMKNYMQSEGVTVETSSMDETASTILEAVIPGDHPYMATEKLWVDNNTFLPSKLVIYDNKGAETIVVLFMEFEYNVKLEENIFKVANTN